MRRVAGAVAIGLCGTAALLLAGCNPNDAIDQLTKPPRYNQAVDDQLKAIRDAADPLFARLMGPPPGCRYSIDQPDAAVIDKDLKELAPVAEAADPRSGRNARRLLATWRGLQSTYADVQGGCLKRDAVATARRDFERRLRSMIRYEESKPRD